MKSLTLNHTHLTIPVRIWTHCFLNGDKKELGSRQILPWLTAPSLLIKRDILKIWRKTRWFLLRLIGSYNKKELGTAHRQSHLHLHHHHLHHILNWPVTNWLINSVDWDNMELGSRQTLPWLTEPSLSMKRDIRRTWMPTITTQMQSDRS